MLTAFFPARPLQTRQRRRLVPDTLMTSRAVFSGLILPGGRRQTGLLCAPGFPRTNPVFRPRNGKDFLLRLCWQSRIRERLPNAQRDSWLSGRIGKGMPKETANAPGTDFRGRSSLQDNAVLQDGVQTAYGFFPSAKALGTFRERFAPSSLMVKGQIRVSRTLSSSSSTSMRSTWCSPTAVATM